MPLRGYLTASILQPVPLKRNRDRKRKAANWLFMGFFLVVTYLLIYFAGRGNLP